MGWLMTISQSFIFTSVRFKLPQSYAQLSFVVRVVKYIIPLFTDKNNITHVLSFNVDLCIFSSSDFCILN